MLMVDDLTNRLAEANAHLAADRLPDAEELFSTILDDDPECAPALLGLGTVMHKAGNHAAAVPMLEQAIARAPDLPQAHLTLGLEYYAAGRYPQAIAVLQEAVAAEPENAFIHNHLGMALQRIGEIAAAGESFQRAIALNPEFADAYNNHGVILQAQGRLAESATAYERALTLRSDYPQALWNRALVRLIGGDYAGGFADFEARLTLKDKLTFRRNFDRPVWQGEPIAGKILFLYAEQGFGDVMMFCRYAKLLAEMGIKVILEVQGELGRLLQSLSHAVMITQRGDPVPPHDYVLPIMSLPLRFGTVLTTIPAPIPYLAADPRLIETAEQRLDGLDGYRIGIAWAGRPDHPNDHNRSMRLQEFAPLAALPDINLVSLQKGPAEAELREGAIDFPILALGQELNDFAETAAIVHELDLVIAVDTAVAHLAGAIGQNLWLMLPFANDWRWLKDIDHSPWYPQARLFRQKTLNSWPEVMTRIAAELATMRRQD